MLVNLHVKNFAIIDEIDVDFGSKLNILTGETGAGKSILIGSIGIALGARVSPEIIGKNGDYAMVEIVFQIDDEKTEEQLRELDVELEDGQVVISRRITENRSINKINGASVPVNVIRQVAALCIDIHGQHEHQSLLHKDKHLAIVDEYASEECYLLKQEIARLYREYNALKKEWEQDAVSDEERARQQGFLNYEKQEIEAAALRPGEIEEVEETYRRASHAGSIVESLGMVHQLTSETAGNAVSHALQNMQRIAGLDESITGFQEELLQIEGLLGDFNHEIADFMSDFSFDENELMEMERRLDCIHNLQSKYGNTYEDIMNHLQEVDDKLLKFADYEAYLEERRRKMDACEEALKDKCHLLSAERKKAAEALQVQIAAALADLNFAYVDFEIAVTQKDTFGSQGWDEVEFLIATNPGEPKRSLGKIASGGELSRIMLAIKSVFAETDRIGTLIFDEIDTGISGRTAQKVSEKLKLLSRSHQVICITHLAQIAAMADTHFVIEKMVQKDRSETQIRKLDERESEQELARILGGVEITESVLNNAREMKKLASEHRSF
ncbi:MAG: DNA repair protein RecN [Eubacterium sp.]|nr:DNA repair protein RecN [Eubacterium sp.]